MPPLSFCLQSFPASGSFPMSQLFTTGGQRIGASTSASILPVNIQGWFPLGLTGLIPLLSMGLSRVFSSTTIQKHQFFVTQSSLWFKGCQSYDKPRQHIKKQRHYFAVKGPYSQSYGFSSSHGRMWELNHIDVFLDSLAFIYDPMNAGNLISGSSVFSKSSLCIWKFSVHLLLKRGLRDFEHDLASMWNEHNCTVVWTFFGIALLWNWNENWPFPVLWPLLNFPNLLAYWVQHFTSIIF